jgi:hypothetical protein
MAGYSLERLTHEDGLGLHLTVWGWDGNTPIFFAPYRSFPGIHGL